MPLKGDLHCHSTYSDGSCTPKELITFAQKSQLNVLALTDHDTMVGYAKISTYAKEVGITIIPALELTTRDYATGRPVHMLCYYSGEQVLSIAQSTVQKRHNSKVDCILNMQKDFNITLDDVLQYQGESVCLHQPHVMKALSQMGYCHFDDKELKRKIFGKASSYFHQFQFPDVWQACEAVAADGALAVIAHPGEYDSLDLCLNLAKQGKIHGLECFHPRNSQEATMQSLTICKDYNLLTTGGTDFHGAYSSTPHLLGSYLCPEDSLLKILNHKQI